VSVPDGWELVDLHNHSERSYDGSNTLADFERAYAAGRFDVLGITDHNRIDGALELRERASFPVVVGMEVDTAEGELIGLFLSEPLPVLESARRTAEHIRGQGGLVYLQHPFYRIVRTPLRTETRSELVAAGLIDVVEVRNGGLFTGSTDRHAAAWAAEVGLPIAGASDAHEPPDIGRVATAVPPGPLEPASLRERLESAIVVDRHRSSVLQIATKARYRFFAEIPRRLRRAPRRRRVP
jgi:predicted metal-dependent phosphoesterase TrpH